VRTVRSHGWLQLAPNHWVDDQDKLERVLRLSGGAVVLLRIQGRGSAERPAVDVGVHHEHPLTDQQRHEIRDTVSHMLRLDEDLSDFYRLCRESGYPWARLTAGMGRLLRSPTLFEDVVKTILTTNMQWSGTLRMVSGLVDHLGEPYPGDPERHAFPTPEAMAAAPAEMYSDTVRLGYRGPYIRELAERVTAGELDLESLSDRGLRTEMVRKRLLAIKGVGRYASANLLMLLGRYDAIPVDTEFRQFMTKRYFCGAYPSDREAVAVYDEWGRWKFLAYWFDLLQEPEET
jgi:3-methyladenine DNA glycosylase/8-oxoguanine DNA glycosylase